jgi:hypothetical protein
LDNLKKKENQKTKIKIPKIQIRDKDTVQKSFKVKPNTINNRPNQIDILKRRKYFFGSKINDSKMKSKQLSSTIAKSISSNNFFNNEKSFSNDNSSLSKSKSIIKPKNINLKNIRKILLDKSRTIFNYMGNEKKRDKILFSKNNINATKKILLKSIGSRNKTQKNYFKMSNSMKNAFDKYINNKMDYRKNDVKKFREIFDEEVDDKMKRIKQNYGKNIPDIWIKNSTANLITFGKLFQKMSDDAFFREKNRILKQYPMLEKEAKILSLDKREREDEKIFDKLKNNEKIIRNYFIDEEYMLKKIRAKYF